MISFYRSDSDLFKGVFRFGFLFIERISGLSHFVLSVQSIWQKPLLKCEILQRKFSMLLLVYSIVGGLIELTIFYQGGLL